MNINSNDIRKMVSECLNRLLLTEIKMELARERFYSQIPEQAWKTLVVGAKNMTPFHKKVADFMLNSSDPGSLAALASTVWNMSNTAQQFLVNSAKEGYSYYEKEEWLREFLRDIIVSHNRSGYKKFSENEFLEDGLAKLYEDENILITCTLSYTAEANHYGTSHWCTASGVEGKYDGFRMFKNYTVEDGSDYGETPILVQVCDKNNSTHAYQIQVKQEGFGQICDFEDNDATINQVVADFGSVVRDVIDKIAFKKLSELTYDYVASEEHYYNFKAQRFKAKAEKFVRERLSDDAIKTASIEYLKQSLKDSCDQGDGGQTPLFYYWVQKVYRNHVAILLDFDDYGYNMEDKFHLFTEAERNYITRASENNCVIARISAILEIDYGREGTSMKLIAWFPSSSMNLVEDKVIGMSSYMNSSSQSDYFIVDAMDGKFLGGPYPACNYMMPSRRTAEMTNGQNLYAIGRHPEYHKYELFALVNTYTGEVINKHENFKLSINYGVWIKDTENPVTR